MAFKQATELRGAFMYIDERSISFGRLGCINVGKGLHGIWDGDFVEILIDEESKLLALAKVENQTSASRKVSTNYSLSAKHLRKIIRPGLMMKVKSRKIADSTGVKKLRPTFSYEELALKES